MEEEHMPKLPSLITRIGILLSSYRGSLVKVGVGLEGNLYSHISGDGISTPKKEYPLSYVLYFMPIGSY